MTVEEFDVVVVGTGAAGLTAALRAAAEGAAPSPGAAAAG